MELWIAIYTRKSRHLDKEIPEDELFRKHRDALQRHSQMLGLEIPEGRYFQEVGTSESVEARPVFSALMEEIDRLPYRSGGHLVIMDQDRLSRAEMGELGLILDRIRRAGVVVHQVLGGDLDLTDSRQYNIAGLKGIVARMIIEDYKTKQRDSWDTMRRNGEVRQGKVPFGYWWDGREMYTRDRIKADTRPEESDETGFTRWEKLCRICDEVLHVSVAQLAHRYHVPETTLYSVLSTPTIAGYPVTRTEPNPEGKTRGAKRRKLPRDRWIWPEKPGGYPAACTLDHWWRIQEAIEQRRASKTKNHAGEGICRDVVRFVGCHGPVVLGSINSKQAPPSYRQLPSGRRSSRGAMDVERQIVDAHATEAIRRIVSDAAFFGWMIADYYQHRQQEEPEDADRQITEVNRQIGQWRSDMDKARRWAYAATNELEERGYREDVVRLAGLVQAWEVKKAHLKAERSRIPAVDAAVPILAQLARQFDPAFWATHWQEIWDRLPMLTRRLLVNMCIKEIPVRYVPPAEVPRGAYRGPAQRVILPVIYSDFVEAARLAYVDPACKIVCPDNIGELWAEIDRLVLVSAA